jgi:hypothetical protein
VIHLLHLGTTAVATRAAAALLHLLLHLVTTAVATRAAHAAHAAATRAAAAQQHRTDNHPD